ncbi:MAG: hypothetical protein JWM93_3768 [Frankiales bacterium]|nr:hypothetical protein [Frankiales bacterium]
MQNSWSTPTVEVAPIVGQLKKDTSTPGGGGVSNQY